MIRPALQAIMEAEADFSGHCCSAFQLPCYNNCFFAGIFCILCLVGVGSRHEGVVGGGEGAGAGGRGGRGARARLAARRRGLAAAAGGGGGLPPRARPGVRAPPRSPRRRTRGAGRGSKSTSSKSRPPRLWSQPWASTLSYPFLKATTCSAQCPTSTNTTCRGSVSGRSRGLSLPAPGPGPVEQPPPTGPGPAAGNGRPPGAPEAAAWPSGRVRPAGRRPRAPRLLLPRRRPAGTDPARARANPAPGTHAPPPGCWR